MSIRDENRSETTIALAYELIETVGKIGMTLTLGAGNTGSAVSRRRGACRPSQEGVSITLQQNTHGRKCHGRTVDVKIGQGEWAIVQNIYQ